MLQKTEQIDGKSRWVERDATRRYGSGLKTPRRETDLRTSRTIKRLRDNDEASETGVEDEERMDGDRVDEDDEGEEGRQRRNNTEE